MYNWYYGSVSECSISYLYLLFISANYLLIQKCYSLLNTALYNAINITSTAEENYPITYKTALCTFEALSILLLLSEVAVVLE